MAIFEPSPPAPDNTIEVAGKFKAEQGILGESVWSKIADTKRAIDSFIEARVETVKNILRWLDPEGLEDLEVATEREILNPEEILSQVSTEFGQNKNLDIDGIFRILLNSGLKIRAIQAWLVKSQHEIQFLRSSEIVTELATRSEHVHQIERSMQEILNQRQEFAINAVEQLFREVVEKYGLLREKLTAPKVKQELNEDLIAREVIPVLKHLQSEGKMTEENAEEYLVLLKAQLAEGSQKNWYDPIKKEEEALFPRRKRLNELYKISGRLLVNLVSSEYGEPADTYYDQIFDFLIREATKEKIEQLRDTFRELLSPELQARLDEIAEGIINPHFDWQTPKKQRPRVLDLRKLPIAYLYQLRGLERWQVVKKFAESSGVIQEEVFSRVEEIIIERLFAEQIFPSGANSTKGYLGIRKIGQLGNPQALPFILRYIEIYGSDFNSDAVVDAMERLLKANDPTKLQQVLDSLPETKRVLLETLADKNSYMNRFSRSNGSYDICILLHKGDKTIQQERYTKILENAGVPEEELRQFYLLLGDREKLLENIIKIAELTGEDKKKLISDYFQELTSHINPDNSDSLKILHSLAKELEVSKVELLARCAERFEHPPRNPILQKLASLENKEYGSLLIALAKTFFGLDQNFIEKLSEICLTKDLQSGLFERGRYLEGLFFLRRKDNGKAVIEKLLSAYKGSKDDPRRIGKIFRFLVILDNLGEYDFVTPDQKIIESIEQEISNLESQLPQIQDKAKKKEIENKIKRLNSKYENLTGLNGIRDAMRQRVVEVVCKRLDLPQEDRDKDKDKMESQLEDWINTEVFEIISSLAGQYESKNEMEVKNLLRIIIIHIFEGDFKSWRYSHEQSEVQLDGLTADQKEFWKTNLEPITVDVELSEDEISKRADELTVVKEIIRNAKEHILHSRPDFVFSKEKTQKLANKVSKLTSRIRSTSSEEERQQIALEKRIAEAEAALINGMLEMENLTPQSFTHERILALAKQLYQAIIKLELPLAALDLEQIEKVFTVGDIQSLTAHESDDPLILLNVGTKPRETCQSWRYGEYNECLLAYVADSNKKVVNIVDETGRIVARVVIKLIHQRDENDSESTTQRKTLFVEPTYSLFSNPAVYRALIRVLLTKAKGLNASITFEKSCYEDVLLIFEEEACAFGYKMEECNLEIFIPRSLNKYEYSDTLGGRISDFGFDIYKPLRAVTLEPAC